MNTEPARLGIYREGDFVSERSARDLVTLAAARNWVQHPVPGSGGYILRRRGAMQA